MIKFRFPILFFVFVGVLFLSACNTAGELPQGPVTPIVPAPGAAATHAAQSTAAPAQPVGTLPPVDIPTASAPVPVTLPQQQPAAQRGQSIYAANCLPCHGASGNGDGPQSQQIAIAMGGQLPNLADPAYVRSVKPTDWFNVISNGRMQKGMPPFSSLTADERWDLVSYLYSLSISQDQLDKGKAVYADKCASCHGATGKPADSTVPDLSDAAKMAGQSQGDLDAVVLSGKGAMPSYASVSQADRQAAADYVRSLSMDLTAAPKGAAVIIGSFVNGTPGGRTPGYLPVTLYALSPDGSSLMFTRTLNADANGQFVFDQLDASTPIMYGLQTEYLQATYTSEALSFAHSGLTLTAPITVYETTTDAANISVEQMHVFFDFSSPGATTVGQLYVMSNTGDRAYVGADGLSARFQLPAGAMNLRFMDGELGGRYKSIDNGFADTEAVAPGTGSSQIFVSYDLPYDGKKLDLRVPMVYAVKSLNVLLPQGGVELTSPQLTNVGTRAMQDGSTMVNFTGGGLAAGASLALQLSGAPSPAAAAGATAQPTLTASPILMAAAVLLLAVVAVVTFVWLRQQRQAEAAEEQAEETDVEDEQDELLGAIARLDDEFEAGRIEEADYRRQRAELKAELKALMKSEG